MSILGGAIYVLLVAGIVYFNYKFGNSNFAKKYPSLSLLISMGSWLTILPLGMAFQYAGINMGMFLMYKGSILVPAGGI